LRMRVSRRVKNRGSPSSRSPWTTAGRAAAWERGC
jgi:hypothetical protein